VSARAAWLAGALALACAAVARAQDFASPAPADAAWAAGPPAVMLEHGWPAARAGLALAAGATSWYAVPGLTTRSLALGLGWRALRLAAGVSQTGEPAFGWESAGLALGCGSPRGGAALRALMRRDRAPLAPDGGLGAGVGLEAGAGAWLATPGGAALYASAPQIARSGVAAPLVRPLVVGVSFGAGGARGWLAREAPASRDPGGGVSAGGLALAFGAARAWAEVRDRPLRGALGLSAGVRALAVAASVESHPVLGETARVALVAGARTEAP
jgi:hypothetical protein